MEVEKIQEGNMYVKSIQGEESVSTRVRRRCSLQVKATGEVVPHFRTHDPTFMASEYLGNLIIFYFHLPPISNITEWGVNYWISFKNYLILAIIYVTRVHLSWGHLQTDPFMPHSWFWWISSVCPFSLKALEKTHLTISYFCFHHSTIINYPLTFLAHYLFKV